MAILIKIGIDEWQLVQKHTVMKKFLILFLSVALSFSVDAQLVRIGTHASAQNKGYFPAISGYSHDPLNRFVDVFFDPNAYHSSGGAVVASDLQLNFVQNGGTATNVVIASVTTTAGGALSGGENVIRVNITVTGTPDGLELIQVRPSATGSIKDSFNRPIGADKTTGEYAIDPTYTTEHQVVLLYALNNSIIVPTRAQRIVNNTLYASLVSTGAWAEFDVAWTTASNVPKEYAYLNIKDPTVHPLQVVTSITSTNYSGFKSDNTGYLKTNWTPATHGVKYLQDDASVWILSREDTQDVDPAMGARGNAGGTAFTGNTRVVLRNTSNQIQCAINCTSNSAPSTPGSDGLHVVSRESASFFRIYRNGTQNAAGAQFQTSTIRSDQEIMLCSENSNGTIGGKDNTHNIGFLGFGSGMQDILSSVSSAINTWATATYRPTPTYTGRLYLLAGQSNMDGAAQVSTITGHPELLGVLPRCYVWWDNEWQPLEAGVNGSNIPGNFGPLISLAYDESIKHPTGDLFFVIHALGGTRLDTQWQPGQTQYNALLAKYNDALASLTVTSYEAFFWGQGEADASFSSAATAYQTNEQTFIASIVANTGFTKSIVMQLHNSLPIGTYPYFATVQTAKTNNDTAISNYTLITTSDLGLQGDNVHFSAAGYITLGQRYSAAF